MSTTEHKALYADRNPRKLEPHYTAHVLAMTREDLHSKSDIAAELAWRDQQIDALRAQVEALSSGREAIAEAAVVAANARKGLDGLSEFLTDAPSPLTRPAVPEGWRLVPIEPTPEMAKAGCYRFCAAFVQDYCAMIAAAPQPPAQVAGPAVTAELAGLFREALAWGKVWGQRLAGNLWDEMREEMVLEFTRRAAAPQPPYKDSTPHLSVGDSSFESWYSTYNPAHKGDKQRARDAYAAGMGDPLVQAAPQPEAVVNQSLTTEAQPTEVGVAIPGWTESDALAILNRISDGPFGQADVDDALEFMRYVDDQRQMKILAAVDEAQPTEAAQPINLAIIRKWPEGFEARLDDVWNDVIGCVPNVRLYDLQRVLALFGFTMTITEAAQKGGV